MELKNEELLNYTLAKLRDTPNLVQNHILRDGKLLNKRKGYHKIEEHAQNFLDGRKENRFIVMPGLRRIGKTTILFQLYDHLVNEKGIEQDRILYISADETSAYFHAKLMDIIDVFIADVHRSSPVNLEKELFIMVDEAHYDKNWSLIGKMLYDKSEKLFMVFTGSSALSLEMNVDEATRAVKEPIFPMNFCEYLMLKYKIMPPEGTSEHIRDLIFNATSESIENASAIENEMMKRTLALKNPLEKEWEDFLYCGGFPLILSDAFVDCSYIHDKIFHMVENVIQKDVFPLDSFKTETISTIFNVILFLALQDPGPTSQVKLARNLNVSSSQVKKIINALEKTHLIFNIKPFGGIGKTIKKPWKYYFLSPTIKAAINYNYGRYDQRNRKFLGILAENLVASSFFKLKKTTNLPKGVFYSAETHGVDFLLHGLDGDIIPVEVGIGRDKSNDQVKRAIRKYKSQYGILISNKTQKITQDGDVIYMPLTTFSFL